MKVNKIKWMIICAVILVITGIILIMMGLWLPPVGEIHPSVLTALGEILSFSGCLFGIDANYKFKEFNIENKKYNDKKSESEL